MSLKLNYKGITTEIFGYQRTSQLPEHYIEFLITVGLDIQWKCSAIECWWDMIRICDIWMGRTFHHFILWHHVLRVRYEQFSVKRTISVHYTGVIMRAMASQIPSVTEQWKHQSSASLAFVREIHQWPLNSIHIGPVTRKMFPFDDFIISRSSMITTSRHDWWELLSNRLCTRAAALTARKCGPVFMVHDKGHRVKRRKLFSSHTPRAKQQTAFQNCHGIVQPNAFWYRSHSWGEYLRWTVGITKRA